MFPRPQSQPNNARRSYLIFVFALVSIGLIAAYYVNILPSSTNAPQLTRMGTTSVPSASTATATSSTSPSMGDILAKAAAVSTSSAVAGQPDVFSVASKLIAGNGGGQPNDIASFFLSDAAKCTPKAECGTFDPIKGRSGQPVTWTIPKAADFNTDIFRSLSTKLGMDTGRGMHRKYWEWYFIYDVLANKFPGLVAPGKKGVGFGVGREPLPSAFAALGAEVKGTDMAPTDAGAQGWASTNQHASDGKSSMFYPSLVNKSVFDRLVSFEFSNMNQLPAKWHNQFDFVWSSCSMEHVGSLEQSTRFFLESTKLLKPGGVTMHTTEFLLNGLDHTIESGWSIIWRYKDVVRVRDELIKMGFKVFPIDVQVPDTTWDKHVDRPPYPDAPGHHLKMFIGDKATTSIALIVQKPA